MLIHSENGTQEQHLHCEPVPDGGVSGHMLIQQHQPQQHLSLPSPLPGPHCARDARMCGSVDYSDALTVDAVVPAGSAPTISDLIETVETLQQALLRVSTESQAQLVLAMDRLGSLTEEVDRLRTENEQLKSRVASDVLRQRQACRMEMASERHRIVSCVRSAGLRRLECMEGVLMEAHDDLYHIQRWDAAILPQRNISFVFHYVSGNCEQPSECIESFVGNLCRRIFSTLCRTYEGHLVAVWGGAHVFVFQDPDVALHFASDCHEQMVGLSWPERMDGSRSLPTIMEGGKVLYRGPRIHTCIYACSPSSEVNPSTGKCMYFGPEVRDAVKASLELSAVGEVIVNDTWANLYCQAARRRQDSGEPVRGNAADIRGCLGSEWDVIEMPGTRGIVASILPASLKGRRGVQPNELHPSPRYPLMDMNGKDGLCCLVQAMKGEGAACAVKKPQSRQPLGLNESTAPGQWGWVLENGTESPSELLERYRVQRSHEELVALQRETSRFCEAMEQEQMQREDRFIIAKQKPLDPSETAYICTLDRGDDDTWKHILPVRVTPEECNSIDGAILASVHKSAQSHFGFRMNGNSHVFTYAFREAYQALDFAADIYIMVNRTATKYCDFTRRSDEDTFVFRAGIACGSMSTIYRVADQSNFKCTGPVIRLSGTLCDLAYTGEILVMDDVIRDFYRARGNTIDNQFNITKRTGKLFNEGDSPGVVHSALPKSFAFRRTKLISKYNECTPDSRGARSVVAFLIAKQQHFSRDNVANLLQQLLERVEKCEETQMVQEDLFETSVGPSFLRNPWSLTQQQHLQVDVRSSNGRALSASRQSGVEACESVPIELGFLFCDVVSTTAIGRSLPQGILQAVYAHYNHIVQRCLVEYHGYVVRTNSTTAYIVVFEQPYQALEAALSIQLQLNSALWPTEVNTIDPTLQVRDIHTGITIYNGPRVQMAVHASRQYHWRTVLGRGGGRSEEAPVHIDVVGTGLDELTLLGRCTFGGEIGLSKAFMRNVVRHTRGKCLIGQLSLALVPAPSSTIVGHVECATKSNKRISGSFRARTSSTSLGTTLPNVTPLLSAEQMDDTTASDMDEFFVGVPRRLKRRLTWHASSARGVTVEVGFSDNTVAVRRQDTDSTGAADRSAHARPLRTLATSTDYIPLPPPTAAQTAWYTVPQTVSNPLPAAAGCLLSVSDRDVSTQYQREANRLQCRLNSVLQALSGDSSSPQENFDGTQESRAAVYLEVKRKVGSPLENSFLPRLGPASVPVEQSYGRFMRAVSELLKNAQAAARMASERTSSWSVQLPAGSSVRTIPRNTSITTTKTSARTPSNNGVPPFPPRRVAQPFGPCIAATSGKQVTETDPFAKALNYLNESCRASLQRMGDTTSNSPSLPAAPSFKANKMHR